MFKDFTGFNSLGRLLFKDEPFSLIMKAFNSFQSLLVALRTEAYDYATWYNKVMRDKYEDGAPVDVTDLPYLSVPRSQLAVMRARIAKVKETVQYAAGAITNIALGAKVNSPVRLSYDTDDITPTLSGTTQSTLNRALKLLRYALGDLVISFTDGQESVTVNGVAMTVSPLVEGQFTIAKYNSGNDARAAVGSYQFNIADQTPSKRLRSVPGEILRRIARAPEVIARSRADLAASSDAPIAIQIASLTFFNKKLIIWAESTTRRDSVVLNGTTVADLFNTNIKAALINSGDERSTIASSLYGYMSEDYVEAMSFHENTVFNLVSMFDSDQTTDGFKVFVNGYTEPINTVAACIAMPLYNDADPAPVYTSMADVTDATTQTAIADLFFTEQEWDDLIASLSEA